MLYQMDLPIKNKSQNEITDPPKRMNISKSINHLDDQHYIKNIFSINDIHHGPTNTK